MYRDWQEYHTDGSYHIIGTVQGTVLVLYTNKFWTLAMTDRQTQIADPRAATFAAKNSLVLNLIYHFSTTEHKPGLLICFELMF